MKHLETLVAEYRRLGITGVIDHDTFNLIAIDHHSTRIEGSTLTAVEAQVLINEGRTPKGKPLEDSLMVKDHHAALLYTIEKAKQRQPVTVQLLQEINSRVMKNTGRVYNTMLGTVDSSTGAFRKGNVSAGITYFPNFDKVNALTGELVKKLNASLASQALIEDQLRLSFDAHFNLVSIHPYYDGNGRTSRLLMNFIQAYFDLPLAIVYSDNKAAYIEALVNARQSGDIEVFRNFMAGEYTLLLSDEITRYNQMIDPPDANGYRFLF